MPVVTKRYPDSRSEARAAAVLVRMSHDEREALRAAAERRGTTPTELLRQQMLQAIGKA